MQQGGVRSGALISVAAAPTDHVSVALAPGDRPRSPAGQSPGGLWRLGLWHSAGAAWSPVRTARAWHPCRGGRSSCAVARRSRLAFSSGSARRGPGAVISDRSPRRRWVLLHSRSKPL